MGKKARGGKGPPGGGADMSDNSPRLKVDRVRVNVRPGYFPEPNVCPLQRRHVDDVGKCLGDIKNLNKRRPCECTGILVQRHEMCKLTCTGRILVCMSFIFHVNGQTSQL